MNEALKNRFVVIHVDYIDGDILKNVIKRKVYYKMINKSNKLLSLMKIYVLCLSR